MSSRADNRLIGTWQSDRRRTAKEIGARRDIPPLKRQALANIFGRLQLRYTRSRCYSTFEGKTTVFRYRIVARDATSLVLVGTPVSADEAESIQHIRFERDHYSVCLGSFREYFRRV